MIKISKYTVGDWQHYSLNKTNNYIISDSICYRDIYYKSRSCGRIYINYIKDDLYSIGFAYDHPLDKFVLYQEFRDFYTTYSFYAVSVDAAKTKVDNFLLKFDKLKSLL